MMTLLAWQWAREDQFQVKYCLCSLEMLIVLIKVCENHFVFIWLAKRNNFSRLMEIHHHYSNFGQGWFKSNPIDLSIDHSTF